MSWRCDSGKVRYRSKDQAVRALRALSNSTRQKVPGRYYLCPSCNGFHLTST